MTISNQQRPRFSGMVYSEKLIEGQIAGGSYVWTATRRKGF